MACINRNHIDNRNQNCYYSNLSNSVDFTLSKNYKKRTKRWLQWSFNITTEPTRVAKTQVATIKNRFAVSILLSLNWFKRIFKFGDLWQVNSRPAKNV